MGLTAHLKKYCIGWMELQYLCFHLGHEKVSPRIDKTSAIVSCLRSKTEKEMGWFLGLAGYYHRSVPNYLDATSLLTDLTQRRWSSVSRLLLKLKHFFGARCVGSELSRVVGPGLSTPALGLLSSS